MDAKIETLKKMPLKGKRLQDKSVIYGFSGAALGNLAEKVIGLLTQLHALTIVFQNLLDKETQYAHSNQF